MDDNQPGAPGADSSGADPMLDSPGTGAQIPGSFGTTGRGPRLLSGGGRRATVISTASTAAQRGFEVVVPVDAVAANESYSEQYTVWHLSHAPFLALHTKLTKLDMIKF